MKQTMLCILLVFLFTACTKTQEPPLLPTPGFAATIDGNQRRFTDYTMALSQKNSAGQFKLYIIGEQAITNDSSNQIRFVVPDFTLSDTTQKTYTLSTNFDGNFIEWKVTPNSTKGAYHFYQTGQLTLRKKGNDLLEGDFQLVYFTFDKFAQKTGEHTITNGTFTNLKITRMN